MWYFSTKKTAISMMWILVLVWSLGPIDGIAAQGKDIALLDDLIPKCTPPQPYTKTCLLNFEKDAAGNCLCECATSRVIFGDIIINEATYRIQEQRLKEAKQPGSRQTRAALRNAVGQWPDNGTHVNIIYEFGAGLNASIQRTVEHAIQHYDGLTCVRFLPKTGSQTANLTILPSSGANNCYAGIGYDSSGTNKVFLGDVCGTKVGTVLHELMHVLGFFHEQQRPDRDLYVRIRWTNIKPDKWSQYYTMSSRDWQSGSQYDIHSVMQYGSLNPFPTMTERWSNLPILQPQNFSYEDVRQIQTKYCPASALPQKSIPAMIAAPVQRLCIDNYPLTDILVARKFCLNRGCNTTHPSLFSRRYCRFTCGLCNYIQPAARIPCEDLLTDSRRDLQVTYCQDLKIKGICRRDWRFMEAYCPSTCGFCPGMPPIPRPTSNICKDLAAPDMLNATRLCRSSVGCRTALDQQMCPFTCGLCQSYRTLYECRDYAKDDVGEARSYCLRLRNAGYCNPSSPYLSFTQSYCRFTCGYCPALPTTGFCLDKAKYNNFIQASSCIVWKVQLRCRDDPVFMNRFCPVTCQVCPPKTITKSCKDDCLSRNNFGINDCVVWKRAGLCISKANFMKKHCARTCNFCYDATF